MEIEYIIKEDGSAAITKISNPESILQIPEVLDGHPVTELCSDFIPFGVKSTVHQVHLPKSVLKIGSRAFRDMRWLKELTLPDSLTEIDQFGIYTCPDLTELYIPSSVKTFGTCAFGYMYEHGRAYKLNYFTLLCEEDSPAKKFAEENGIKFQISPKGV